MRVKENGYYALFIEHMFKRRICENILNNKKGYEKYNAYSNLFCDKRLKREIRKQKCIIIKLNRDNPVQLIATSELEIEEFDKIVEKFGLTKKESIAYASKITKRQFALEKGE